MMPPHKQQMSRSGIYSLIAAGALVLLSVIASRGQLTVIDFVNTPPPGYGPALEDTLRNSQRAVMANIIAAHNGSWAQRSNHFHALFIQASNATFRLENIEYNTENIWDGVNTVVNQLGYVRDNGQAATNFLAMILTNLNANLAHSVTNYEQNETMIGYAHVLQDMTLDILDSSQATANQLTNANLRFLSLTNIQTGSSNVLASMFSALGSISNLLVQTTNKLQIDISFDTAMSNSLYQINNASSWFSYIAENTKQTTNFLSIVNNTLRGSSNLTWSTTNILTGMSNLAAQADARLIAQTNTLVGLSNLAGLTYSQILSNVALQRVQTNNEATMIAHLGQMRSNTYFLGVTNALSSISNSMMVVSNTAGETFRLSEQVREFKPGDLYDISGTNYSFEKQLSNFAHHGENIVNYKMIEVSNALSKMELTVAEATDQTKPAGFLMMNVAGREFNFDARDHAKWAGPVSAMRDFIGWVVVCGFLFIAWKEARTAIFITQLTPQMKVPELQILGNNFGPAAYVVWLPIMCAALVTIPVAGVNAISSNTFFTHFLDFSGSSGGVVTNPFSDLATSVAGIYYFVDTYIPVPTIFYAGVSYFTLTAQFSLITIGTAMAIKALFS